MYLDIKLEQTKDMLCFESALASVAIWWKRRYEMIFSQSWNFDFIWQEAINDSELIINRGDMTGLLKQYHGISTFFHSPAFSVDAYNIVKQELASGRPVYTEIASSLVPWFNEIDKNMNFAAPFIILGLEAPDKIICLDIHYLKKTALLPVSSFIQGCITINTFMLSEEESLVFDWHSAIAGTVEQFNAGSGISPCSRIRLFADFLESAGFNEILADYSSIRDFGNIPVINRVSRIGPSRMIFAAALKYMAGACSCDSLMAVHDKLVYLSNQWYSIRSVLTKEFYAGRLNREVLSRVSAKVRETADLEEAAAKALTQLYTNKTSQALHTVVPNFASSETVPLQSAGNTDFNPNEIAFIDIGSYCNNKAFSSNEENKSKADFTGLGEFFLAEGLPSGRTWNVGRMQFKFIDPIFAEYDNIACNGQIIGIPDGCYHSIMLLGCSEWGSYKDNIDLLFESEIKDSVEVEFADWFTKNPPSGQCLAWEGTSIDSKADSDRFRLRYIYARQCLMGNDSRIDSIRLPNCTNMHLFALSLGVAGRSYVSI